MASGHEHLDGMTINTSFKVLNDPKLGQVLVFMPVASQVLGMDTTTPKTLYGAYDLETDTFHFCSSKEEFEAIMSKKKADEQMAIERLDDDKLMLFDDILGQVMGLPDVDMEMEFIE